jgi:hypothetical protein
MERAYIAPKIQTDESSLLTSEGMQPIQRVLTADAEANIHMPGKKQ